MMVDDCSLIEKIGIGAYGEVYLSSKKWDNLKYASKIMNKPKLRRAQYINVLQNNEISYYWKFAILIYWRFLK